MNKHYPRGQMCLGCIHLLENCSHLPFDKMVKISKPDDEGWIEVRCNNYHKESKDGDGGE